MRSPWCGRDEGGRSGVLLGFAPHGAEPPDFGYLHAIEDEDGHFYLSGEPLPGDGPQLCARGGLLPRIYPGSVVDPHGKPTPAEEC